MSCISESLSLYALEEYKRMIFDKINSKELYWRTFSKQIDAIQHITNSYLSSNNNDHLHIFAEEYPPSITSTGHSYGARQFIVSRYVDFFLHYMYSISAKNRHHYEIIIEQQPCHLYFDIEYNRNINPNITTQQEQEVKQTQLYRCRYVDIYIHIYIYLHILAVFI